MDKTNLETYKRLMAYQIRMCRMMRGYTQQEIADKLQKSMNAISNWELANTSPSVDDMVKLCKILHVTPNQLCGWEENTELKEYIEKTEISPEELEKLKQQKKELNQQIKVYSEILRRKQ